MPTKQCTKCLVDKLLTDFYPLRRKGKPETTTSRCRVCHNADNLARQAANPEKYNARTRAWREKNPGRTTANIRAWQIRNPERTKAIAYKVRYRIDFDTIWKAQGGKCASCQRPMLREGKDPLSATVDHDRSCCPGYKSCGKCVRGIIHRNCNLVLGYAKDDIDILRAAVAYLEKHEAKKWAKADAEIDAATAEQHRLSEAAREEDADLWQYADLWQQD